MIVVVLAIALALAFALAALAVTASLCVRWRRTLETRVAAAAGQIAGEWASRSELAAWLDPAALTQHTLAAVAALPGVDAALLLVDEDGARRAEAFGLSPEEAERAALQTPQNTNLRAMEIVYRYRLDEAGGISTLPRAGLVVPLRADDQAIGS